MKAAEAIPKEGQEKEEDQVKLLKMLSYYKNEDVPEDERTSWKNPNPHEQISGFDKNLLRWFRFQFFF